ncbi:MAG: FHA domain-containing protein [Pirellulales bacterium]|nr:FHA domain-containing protein [Pirellulales bacterium]
MDLRLTVIGGKNADRVIAISGEKFLIGRAEDCHLRPNSDLVSRHHCAILMHQGTAIVRDFGSRNGTLLNGTRIEKEETLHSGDHLRVGPLEFEISFDVNLAGQKKPKVQSVEEAAARTVKSAGAKPGGEDLDISDWIGQNPDGDTKAMKTAQTGTVAMNTPPAAETPPPPDETDKDKDTTEQEEKANNPQPKSPSGVHGVKKPKAPDSQSAAAETLRAFFNRK